MKKDKKIIEAIDLILKDIRKNAISKEHRCAEINPDCAECRFRILEGLLDWYRDLFI
jgi:ferredoxin